MTNQQTARDQQKEAGNIHVMKSFIRATLLVVIATTILRTMGDAVESIAFPWEMLDVTAQLTTVAGISVALMLPWLFLPPFLGKFIDNIRNKALATALATIIQSLCIIIIVIVFFLVRNHKVPSLLGILTLYVLMAIVSSMDIFHDYFTFITIPMIVSNKNESQLQKYNTALKISSGITSFIIYPIIGYGFVILGIYVLGIDVFFLLIAAAFLLFHHRAHPFSKKSNHCRPNEEFLPLEAPRKNLIIPGRKSSWKELLLKTPLLASFLSIPAFNFALGALNVMIIGYLNGRSSNPPFLHGIILSVETVGFLIGGTLLATIFKKISVEKSMVIAMCGESLVLIFLGFLLFNEPKIQLMNLPFLGILAAWTVYSLSSILLSVSGSSFVQKYGNVEQLGTIRGLFDVLATTPILFSKLAVAMLVDNASIPISLLSLSLGLLAMMSTMLFFIIVRAMMKK